MQIAIISFVIKFSNQPDKHVNCKKYKNDESLTMLNPTMSFPEKSTLFVLIIVIRFATILCLDRLI